jgi:hypothetical protein
MTTVKEPLAGPSFSSPPCPTEHKDLRCEFTFSDGRQCSSQRAQFCAHHASRKRRSNADEVAPAPALQGLCSDLTTATNINRALAQVFLLLAQGRISQKQAVAFGYLSQLLLQTVPGIRSEFVSAYGYHPWEQRLKSSLESNDNEDPGGSDSSRESHGDQELSRVNSSRESHGHQELSRVNKATSPSAHEKVGTDDPPSTVILSAQRRISPEDTPDKEISPPPPPPINKARLSAQSLREGLTPDDWDSLYHRGRDLFAGKYSVTPEGRREAQALDTDLELIKPPAAKMPKGARASVIEHMKRWIAQKKTPIRSGSASRPPAKVYPPAGESLNAANVYEPRRNVYQQDELSPQRKVELRGVKKEHQELSPLNKVSPPPESETPNAKSPAAPVSPRSSRPEAVSSDPPPTHRPKEKRASAQIPAHEPSARSSPAALEPEIVPASDPPNGTAHTTGWYAPPDWSRNRTPDPFPSPEEKGKRELRSMSNSKLRHLQHRNSRAF